MTQWPLLIGMLRPALLTRHRALQLTLVGGSLAFLGGFCHAVTRDLLLGAVMNAADTANRRPCRATLAWQCPADPTAHRNPTRDLLA